MIFSLILFSLIHTAAYTYNYNSAFAQIFLSHYYVHINIIVIVFVRFFAENCSSTGEKKKERLILAANN